MVINLNGIEQMLVMVMEKAKTDVSFTIELYGIPNLGVKQNATFWIRDRGTKSGGDVMGLLNEIARDHDSGIIHLDRPH